MGRYAKLFQIMEALRKRVKICLLLGFLYSFACINAQHTENYALIFGERYYKAESYLKRYETLFRQRCQEYGIDYRITAAIVFPELIRFSPEKDMLESMSNRAFYGNFGGEYGSFSIGCFQMKPIFIEKIERFVSENSTALQEFLFITEYKYPQEEDKAIRKARIERMSKTEWQIVYACCFIQIMEYRFPFLNTRTTEQKTRFLATAYNRGFEQPEKEIEKWMRVRAFPDGENATRKQYNYGDIAWFIYERI